MKQTTGTWVWFIIAFGIALLIILITTSKQNAETANEDPLSSLISFAPEDLVAVDSMQVEVLESFPVQVQVAVQGTLSNGCEVAGPEVVERKDNTFFVYIPRIDESTADSVCTQALVPFEKTVSLNVLNLPAGTYTVDVHGMTEMFELLVDNTIDFSGDKG